LSGGSAERERRDAARQAGCRIPRVAASGGPVGADRDDRDEAAAAPPDLRQSRRLTRGTTVPSRRPHARGAPRRAGDDQCGHETYRIAVAGRDAGCVRLESMSMEVLLARENGFCFGVKKAVELTEAAAETGKPVYNLGQVVHNPKISERLAVRGVTVIKDPAEAKEGVIVIRAHGVPPETRAKIEAQGLECVDATCSLVLRAQRFTKQLADEGHTVIILGTPEHPEVVGLRGFAPNAIVVETKDEWEQLPRRKKAA